MTLVFLNNNIISKISNLSVNPDTRESFFLKLFSSFWNSPFFPLQGRETLNAVFSRSERILFQDAVNCLRFNFPAAPVTMTNTDSGVKQTKVIVNFCDSSYRRTRIMTAVRCSIAIAGQAFYGFHIRLIHLSDKLTRISGKRFHIPPLTFRIDSIESQRWLTGAAHPVMMTNLSLVYPGLYFLNYVERLLWFYRVHFLTSIVVLHLFQCAICPEQKKSTLQIFYPIFHLRFLPLFLHAR